jgi:hypothetical protein
MSILELGLSELGGDPSRVAVTGQSIGGNGTWEVHLPACGTYNAARQRVLHARCMHRAKRRLMSARYDTRCHASLFPVPLIRARSSPANTPTSSAQQYPSVGSRTAMRARHRPPSCPASPSCPSGRSTLPMTRPSRWRTQTSSSRLSRARAPQSGTRATRPRRRRCLIVAARSKGMRAMSWRTRTVSYGHGSLSSAGHNRKKCSASRAPGVGVGRGGAARRGDCRDSCRIVCRFGFIP